MPLKMKGKLMTRNYLKSKFVMIIIVVIPVTIVFGCIGLFLPNPNSSADLAVTFNTISDEDNPTPINGEPTCTDYPVFQNILGREGHHAATITAFPDGELLAAWYSYKGHDELEDADVFISRRYPDCDTWEKPKLLIDKPNNTGNPVLYSEENEVWLFYAVIPFGWDTAHVEFTHSHNKGITWSETENVTALLGTNVRYPPVRTSTGKLILPVYDEIGERSLFFSLEDTMDWQYLSAIPSDPGNIQPSIIQTEDQHLLAVMRNRSGNWLWTAESPNGGRTWSTPADAGFPNPRSAAQILKLANGHLILIFNNDPSERRQLSVALSTNNGQSWPYVKILNNQPGSCYPSATQAPDGKIHILYTADRTCIRHAQLTEAWIAHSN